MNPTTIIGVILTFIMLSQYNTWILIGVMEEKSSRVIEVLLSALRPLQLLTGKVVGIGLVAFAQAALIVAVALGLSKAVGSSVIHGSAPLAVTSSLLWLVLGYAFYSWVYAAAGSMAERQDQVQSLAFPLSLPMIFGYVTALTGASSGSPNELVKVLAYIPPTAPFDMPVLVGSDAVTWWGFCISVALSVVGHGRDGPRGGDDLPPGDPAHGAPRQVPRGLRAYRQVTHAARPALGVIPDFNPEFAANP